MYVYCGTVHNSKEKTNQMPINDRLDKENVVTYAKGLVHVLCRVIDESGNHHTQQTDTKTENQILHILTHK